MTANERIQAALDVAHRSGSIDGDHHKTWVIDQMIRHLTNCPTETRPATDTHGNQYTYAALGESDEYTAWVAAHNDGEDGPNTYEWDEGIAP